jgi:hypothetical protein
MDVRFRAVTGRGSRPDAATHDVDAGACPPVEPSVGGRGATRPTPAAVEVLG